MRARATEHLLRPETMSFVVWLAVWLVLGFVIGVIVDGHMWLIIPLLAGIHGVVAGTIFAVCARRRRRTHGVSPADGVLFGALAGIVGLLVLWLLSYCTIYTVMIAIPVDIALGAILSLTLFGVAVPRDET